MNRSKIEWCDFTWNPVTGCLHGCFYCYADDLCRRFARPWGLNPADPFKPTFHPGRLNEPLSLKKPSRIFVGSMCDLFGEWVPREWIYKIIDSIETANFAAEAPNDYAPGHRRMYHARHTFIFLTKNPKRYAEFDFPPNCWLGVTVTGSEPSVTQHHLTGCITNLPPDVRFVSWEPILGPLDMDNLCRFSWLILGAMSGPGARKYAPDPRWIEDAEARCRERGIPFFEKSSLAPIVKRPLIQEWPK